MQSFVLSCPNAARHHQALAPEVREPRRVTYLREDQDQTLCPPARTQLSPQKEPNEAYLEQYGGLTENNGFEEHGPTLRSVRQIQTNGWTSMWANQSGYFAQTEKVRFASSYGSFTSDGGMLPR